LRAKTWMAGTRPSAGPAMTAKKTVSVVCGH
jgi:hypothetical protein